MRRLRGAAATVAAAFALAGCGAGAGTGLAQAVHLRVTSGFGSVSIIARDVAHPPAGDSVMALTERYAEVATSYGGGFVDAIDGHANDDSAGSKLDWFFYVDGIEATAGAAATKLAAGDRVWWDLHDWRATSSVPAVVGSFPEPFIGEADHTDVICAVAHGASCAAVLSALRRAGVAAVAAGSLRDPVPAARALTILVGTDAQLAQTAAGKLLSGAPVRSGVYACFVQAGRALELENPAGARVDTLYGGTGLIAAVLPSGARQPTWLVTGTDAAGVALAAGDLSAAKLTDHFAVAVSGSGLLALPQSPTS